MNPAPVRSRVLVSWIVAAAVAAGLVLATGSWAGPPPTIQTARLVIDYGDGVERHYTRQPWQKGATVFDLLEAARQHPRSIDIQYRDYGSSIGRMVTRIDDLANQGGGQESRNWVYLVNDVRATSACDKREIQAGDVVVWKFDLWKP